MSLGGEGLSRRHGRGPADGRSPRRRSPLRLLLLLILLVAGLALLAIGVLLTGRTFGNSVSGKSMAEDSVDSGSNPSLRLSNGRGKIRVEGFEDLESVEYEVTKYALASNREEARDRASEVSAELSKNGSTFVIETRRGQETGADYTLRVPRGSSVELESEAGDVEVTDLEGDVTVRAGAGDVTVKGVGSSVEVQASQGDVIVSDVSTDTGQVDVDVGVGDASMIDLVVGTLDLRVETGDAILAGRFSGSGVARVQTGDLVVRLPAEDTRELDLEARIGDVVSNPDSSGGR